MKIVAVPILDSKDVKWAAEKIVELYRTTGALIYLVNVQPAYPSDISRFFSAKYLEQTHQEDGLQFLAPVVKELDKASIPHWDHILIGFAVERIVEFIATHKCSQVLVRDEPNSLLTRLGFASASTKTRNALRARYR